jgi:hypothetical protein
LKENEREREREIEREVISQESFVVNLRAKFLKFSKIRVKVASKPEKGFFR